MEALFSDELYLFFDYLYKKIIKEVDMEQPLDAIFLQQASGTIDKYWKEYDEILSHYVDQGAKIGRLHYDILLSASKDRAKKFQATKSKDNVRQFLDNGLNTSDSDNLFAPNPEVADMLNKYKFEASETTKKRVTKDINNILSTAYKEGWGPRDVANKIQEKFTSLKTYEARRIAQTEINTSRNMAQYNQLVADEMEYKIWHSAHDSRTRKSHLDVDEEIVPINEPFSNGLMYPGDKSGPVSEWVNCRCSHAAFIMPLGYQAPDFWPFTEADLVKVGSSVSQDYVSQIRERLSVLNGVVVSQAREQKIEKPVEVKPIVKPKKPKAEPKHEPVNAEEKSVKIELQNRFTKDFHTLLFQAEGTAGVELKPIYNKLKKKYKSQVKNRAEFEELFTNAVMSTNTRLYPSRDPDLKVIFGKGKDKRGFGYIDRSKMKKPK